MTKYTNFKVKVKNKFESMKAESALSVLFNGVSNNICKNYDVYDTYPRFIFANIEYINTFTMDHWDRISNTEIGLDELVTLKNFYAIMSLDATHVALDGKKWMKSGDSFYTLNLNSEWIKAGKVENPIETYGLTPLNKPIDKLLSVSEVIENYHNLNIVGFSFDGIEYFPFDKDMLFTLDFITDSNLRFKCQQ